MALAEVITAIRPITIALIAAINDLGLWLQASGLLTLFGLVLGAVAGSTLTALTWRVPNRLYDAWNREASAVLGVPGPASEPGSPSAWRSHCPTCGNTVRARDNLPIIGWLLLRGHCHHCRMPIPLRYPLIEGCTALVSGWLFWAYGWSLTTGILLLFSWCLILLAVIDLEHFLLPDELTGPLLWAALLVSLTPAHRPDTGQAVVAAVLGYLLLWSVNLGYRRLRGRDGMGAGDFKLLAALGAWTGPWALPLILLLASASALAFAVSVGLISRKPQDAVAFGPHLALAGWGLLCVVPIINQ